MEAMNVRLLPYEIGDGATNMAADEVLLQAAATRQIASLRFYGWHPVTASLGYFQKAQDRLLEPAVAALPWVRRATGGATLVHDQEVTYALALPSGKLWQSGQAWMLKMHRIIAAALANLGVHVPITSVERPESHGALLCFQQLTPGDLVCAGAKIVGSAQRKARRCLLQHGGILLARSRHASRLPGLLELTGICLNPADVAKEVVAELQRDTGWRLEPCEWTNAERREIDQTAQQKFLAPNWNERR
jgi:lipoate-protein ligase A